MSIAINPNMQSMALSMAPQQNQAAQQEQNRLTDRSTPTVSAAGNDTVTLSSSNQGLNAVNDYLNLAASQTVNQNNPVQEQNIQSNDVTNGLTYSTSLQAQANFNAQQLNQVAAEPVSERANEA
ncbi:hypothetical protein JX580_11840 [Thiomicrospira microaerophila]|uniref:hypothetical protein n=1 Tax=Thiomicrospira microaerophila TaxID=406020 RepID=UPI00200CD8E4|nr:hypothetical protein [Thiomicrospira microaerophila]UQB42325.1 hypothetical protein JX580_11840 [Thiomicrospira microaerophila]